MQTRFRELSSSIYQYILNIWVFIDSCFSLRLSIPSSLQVSIISSVSLVVTSSFRLSIHPFSTHWQYTYMEVYCSMASILQKITCVFTLSVI